jgi:hypothetical protein
MKTLLILAVLALTITGHAQSYSITSHSIAGGGGTSSGTGVAGDFAVTGSIAQPEASAASTGGSYSVSGGFFSQYIALQQAGAPPLVVRQSGGNVELVWGANVPGWVLQTNVTDLSPAGWADVVAAPTVNGAEQSHAFTASGGRAFFRLRLR